MKKKVSVVGLGKLGLPLAASFAHKGIPTIGVDLNEEFVNNINQGKAPFYEPELDDFIKRLGGSKLKATLDHKEAIESTDVTFILVATPSMPDGTFSNHQIKSALKSLSKAFAEVEKDYHVFVISSTVVPGSVDGSFIPFIEKHSGKKLGTDFDVCFDPDFVKLGSVIHDFLNPELIIIGETSERAGKIVEEIHTTVVDNEPSISHMSIISGEIAKISLNAYITMKISFANTLANLCEKIPGSNVDDITSGIGVDKRISPYFFKGAMPFGGTCFPRDTTAFIRISEQYQNDAHIIKAVERVNQYQHDKLAQEILELSAEQSTKTVGVLGLAFKPTTPVVTESPAIKLIENLVEKGYEIIAYDPLAIENTKTVFGDKITYADTVEECLNAAPLHVVTIADKGITQEIEKTTPESPTLIYDCWRAIDQNQLADNITYIALGAHREN